MAATKTSLEELYANLSLEEEDDGGIVVARGEVKPRTTYVLVRRFLTEKNINFNAMQNVIASLWRLREGMEIHDLGDQIYSFVFFHVLDRQNVLEGGPWTFEQSLLIYHCLQEDEDPRVVKINTMDIWYQIYDFPNGFVSESVLRKC